MAETMWEGPLPVNAQLWNAKSPVTVTGRELEKLMLLSEVRLIGERSYSAAEGERYVYMNENGNDVELVNLVRTTAQSFVPMPDMENGERIRVLNEALQVKQDRNSFLEEQYKSASFLSLAIFPIFLFFVFRGNQNESMRELLEDELRMKGAQIQSLSEELRRVQNEGCAKDHELEAEVSRLSERVSAEKAANARQAASTEMLQSELNAVQQKNLVLDDRVELLEARNKNLDYEVSFLEVRNKNLENKYQALEIRDETLEYRVRSLEGENEYLKQEFRCLKKVFHRLKRKSNRKRKRLKFYRHKSHAL